MITMASRTSSSGPGGPLTRPDAAWALLSTLLAVLGAVLVLGGCGATIPSDPDGTLEQVRGGLLRVGVSTNPPWTHVVDGEPTGLEPGLVEDFAASLDADVSWTVGGEHDLVARLERGELDLVVGGLTAASPWGGSVALTVPYVETTGPHGTELHVMAAPAGENAFLVELERFLLAQEVSA